MENETEACKKCKKEINKSEDNFEFDGKKYCCKECCGDVDKQEHKEEKNNICEFC